MKTRTIALIAVAGLALAACSGGKPEDTSANETIVANIGEPENFSNVTIEEPVAPAATNATSTTATTAPDLAPDEQTQDDADATGMTAKVDRNASEGQPAH
jgi:hypothetical protein